MNGENKVIVPEQKPIISGSPKDPIVIIGLGPAGLVAAIEAVKKGLKLFKIITRKK